MIQIDKFTLWGDLYIALCATKYELMVLDDPYAQLKKKDQSQEVINKIWKDLPIEISHYFAHDKKMFIDVAQLPISEWIKEKDIFFREIPELIKLYNLAKI